MASTEEVTVLRPAALVAGDFTDIEAAHRGHAQAVDRVRRLENEIEQAFGQLRHARRELKERTGVDAIVDLTEPARCAFDRWSAIEEAKEMASSDPSPESRAAQQEREALAIANAAGPQED